MRAIGRISAVEFEATTVKTDKSGQSYNSNRYTIYFEAGDDVHMITVFISVRPGENPEEVLKKKSYFVGARGEMCIKYGFRDWNGKRFTDTEIMSWACDNKIQEAPAAAAPAPAAAPVGPEPSVNDVSASFAESAAQVQVDPDTGLPF